MLPLAQRTRYPGEAGTRGGWGGTPSWNRVFDCSMWERGFLRMFPFMPRLLNGDDLHSEQKKTRALPVSHHKSIFCAGS